METNGVIDTTANLSEKKPLRPIWDVDGDLTEVLWWQANDHAKSGQDTLVFFMIPGNPGAIDYYISFLSTIYAETEGKIEIVGVSHLGHTHGPHNESLTKLWSLQDQIKHKIKVFDMLREKFTSGEGKNLRPPRFILCGHSIGAYTCAQVFKARPNHGIEKVYLLFPTLQHIGKTPNGLRLTWLFNERPRNIVSSLIHSLRVILGAILFKSVVRFITWQSEPHLSTTANRLLHRHVIQNALYMSDTEMKEIHELDEEFFGEYLDKFIFYFGQTDKWAPIDHYYDMVQRFPDGKIFLCNVGMEHAFVLKHSEVMGTIVSGWISDPSNIYIIPNTR